MRILHCISNLLSGGAQQQLSYLAGAQRRSGHDVHIAYVHHGPKLPLFERAGVDLHRFTARGNHEPGLFLEMVVLIRRLRPDVVQTWLRQMDIVGGFASGLLGRPWILTERASGRSYSGGLKAGVRATLGRRADAIVSNSESGDAYWASRVGPPVLRRVVSNAVPIEEIRNAGVSSRRTISLPDGHGMVLYAGRLSPEKNLETLIPALGALAQRIRVTCFLCGDGTHEQEVRRMIGDLGLEDVVRLMGFVDDVWSWLARANVFVSMSHLEGHPNAVLEAAAAGCPLVLSDIPEHRRMLDDSEAVFVDRTSTAAVADALEMVLREPGDARCRASAASLRVALLSVDAMARGYERVYEEILARRGKERTL